MADAAFELGGVRIGCTALGNGNYAINTTTSAVGTLRYIELGGMRIPAVLQGDGTCSFLVVEE